LEKRNATVAVIGAGDFIGGEIAKKFAAEGFTVFVGRRQGEKLGNPPARRALQCAPNLFGRQPVDVQHCDHDNACYSDERRDRGGYRHKT